MLTVVMTSIPASSSSSMSCQRLAFRLPGTLVWASSSTRTTSGRRASTASTSISLERAPRGRRCSARDDLQPSEQLLGVLAAVGLDEADDDVGAPLEAAVALLEHRVGLADAGGGPEVDPQLSLCAIACSLVRRSRWPQPPGGRPGRGPG